MAEHPAGIASDLLERGHEIGLIRNRFDLATSGDGRLVVIEGPAGVGKSELVRAAAQLGREAGVWVLSSRGSELDRMFSLGLVRRLFARPVTDDPSLLTGRARAAAAVFDGERRNTPGEAFYSTLDALYWLLVALSADGPGVLLADDVHWADGESLRWLVYLAERLEDLPVLVVAATRPGEPGADRDLLDALMSVRAGTVTRPSPLSGEATGSIV